MVREIPNRRVAKRVDRAQVDRRFVLRSQTWSGRGLVVVVECSGCGGKVVLQGKTLAFDKFACPGCGRRSNMQVVRGQVRPDDDAVFGK